MSSRNPHIDWPRTLQAACRIIERSDPMPTLDALAAELGVGASELQRQFTRRLGASPKAYGQALQLHRLARAAGGSKAIDAVLDAGFSSVAAAYDRATTRLGAAPARFRGDISIDWWLGLSELGWMLMAATEKGICWLSFGDRPGELLEEMRAAFPKASFGDGEQRLRDWFDAVRDFILLPEEALCLPVDIQGTAFQASVWKALQKIPLGEKRSYSQLAKDLGKPNATRAVASACARNRIALLIPCHRVVGKDGSLAGYRWGVERKRELLERETMIEQ
ncbi:MAG: methylated-DNA--[protein]-cysteine S-methyltransferase [Gammaproteobacteria bacterium]|nr:methylated-DNA--[protein]-cysteine S-methyltransferase [Gammaproteobacteria bacterium]